MRGSRRITFSALVGFLVVLLLAAAGVSAAAMSGEGPLGSGRIRAAGTVAIGLTAASTTTTVVPTTSAAPITTTTTRATAAPGSGTTRPTTSATTARPATPSATAATSSTPTKAAGPIIRSTPANFAAGPANPDYVIVPFSAGTTSWTGVSNGVTITVHTDKATPRAGEPVRFDVDLSSATHVCCGLVLNLAWPAGQQPGQSWLTMAGMVRDADGFIRTVTIDWGDGSAPLSLGGADDLRTCFTTNSGWPDPTLKVILTGTAVHHYAAPGAYTPTLTAVPTACDGTSDPQLATASYLWTVPAQG